MSLGFVDIEHHDSKTNSLTVLWQSTSSLHTPFQDVDSYSSFNSSRTVSSFNTSDRYLAASQAGRGRPEAECCKILSRRCEEDSIQSRWHYDGLSVRAIGMG